MDNIISLNHGSGGKSAARLIKDLFASGFGMKEPLTDSALINSQGPVMAFTTDSYVVDPLFFPGGNIGKLAVCGTVNDLSVSGAIPLYLSAAFIIEEGLPFTVLENVVGSMADEAVKAGVKIVTGDTKVVGKGKCDKLFITTAGTGIMRPGMEHIGEALRVAPGDRLILSGPLGNHSVAVLGARKELSFRTPVVSDCASLNKLIGEILEASSSVNFMRDLTRGGLAACLNDLAQMVQHRIEINELDVPVDEPVEGLCEMFGFDPFYLANEGKILLVTGREESEKILDVMKKNPLGEGARMIGEICEEKPGGVIIKAATGGRRILDMPSGMQLPRIC